MIYALAAFGALGTLLIFVFVCLVVLTTLKSPR